MSKNVYLKRHVYKGHEEACLVKHDELDRTWLGAFDSVESDSPLWRAVSVDNPLIHVCLLADRIYWAMTPDHAKALARWYRDSNVAIFTSEIGDLTGGEFLDMIDGYTKGPLFKVGEWFS